MKSLSEILGNNNEDKKDTSDVRVKPKKDKKKTNVRAQDHGTRLDVHRKTPDEFSNSTDSILGEEVFLLDLGLADKSKLLEETKPQKQNKQSRDRKSVV